MQVMTPEQNERWRKAANPLGFGVSEDQWQAEYVLAALLPPEERRRRIRTILGSERLEEFGVPDWAIYYRETCISRGREAKGVWWPGFALRSDIAMTGLRILYPGHAGANLVYKRVYIRFIREALKPLVDWVVESKGIRLIGYHSLISLYELCESIDTYKEYRRRAKVFRMALTQRKYWTENQFFGLMLVRECRHVADLVLMIILTQRHLSTFMYPSVWPDSRALIEALNKQHQWRLGGWQSVYGPHSDYTELIADAYLTALEAECPPPDWLSR